MSLYCIKKNSLFNLSLCYLGYRVTEQEITNPAYYFGGDLFTIFDHHKSFVDLI